MHEHFKQGKIMNKLLLLSASLLASGLCLAQEVGRVVSSSPIVQQVAVPRQVCNNDQGCTTQTFYENRPIAYTVVYEYGGKQYTVQMPNDPGPSVQLQVTPLAAGSSSAPATVTYAAPVYGAPAYVVTAPPPVYYDYGGYTTYYAPPNYLPLAAFLGLGLVIGSHSYGHGHGHWR